MEDHSLRRFMPKNIEDIAGARAIASASISDVKPLVPEMLRLMNHLKKPVSEEFCSYFEAHGEQFADDIAVAISRDSMSAATHLLLTRVLPKWSTLNVARCVGSLKNLVTRSDPFNSDLLAILLLAQHELADLEWLTGWLKFKISRSSTRLDLATEIASQLGVEEDQSTAEPDS